MLQRAGSDVLSGDDFLAISAVGNLIVGTACGAGCVVHILLTLSSVGVLARHLLLDLNDHFACCGRQSVDTELQNSTSLHLDGVDIVIALGHLAGSSDIHAIHGHHAHGVVLSLVSLDDQSGVHIGSILEPNRSAFVCIGSVLVADDEGVLSGAVGLLFLAALGADAVNILVSAGTVGQLTGHGDLPGVSCSSGSGELNQDLVASLNIQNQLIGAVAHGLAVNLQVVAVAEGVGIDGDDELACLGSDPCVVNVAVSQAQLQGCAGFQLDGLLSGFAGLDLDAFGEGQSEAGATPVVDGDDIACCNLQHLVGAVVGCGTHGATTDDNQTVGLFQGQNTGSSSGPLVVLVVRGACVGCLVGQFANDVGIAGGTGAGACCGLIVIAGLLNVGAGAVDVGAGAVDISAGAFHIGTGSQSQNDSGLQVGDVSVYSLDLDGHGGASGNIDLDLTLVGAVNQLAVDIQLQVAVLIEGTLVSRCAAVEVQVTGGSVDGQLAGLGDIENVLHIAVSSVGAQAQLGSGSLSLDQSQGQNGLNICVGSIVNLNHDGNDVASNNFDGVSASRQLFAIDDQLQAATAVQVSIDRHIAHTGPGQVAADTVDGQSAVSGSGVLVNNIAVDVVSTSVHSGCGRCSLLQNQVDGSALVHGGLNFDLDGHDVASLDFQFVNALVGAVNGYAIDLQLQVAIGVDSALDVAILHLTGCSIDGQDAISQHSVSIQSVGVDGGGAQTNGLCGHFGGLDVAAGSISAFVLGATGSISAFVLGAAGSLNVAASSQRYIDLSGLCILVEEVRGGSKFPLQGNSFTCCHGNAAFVQFAQLLTVQVSLEPDGHAILAGETLANIPGSVTSRTLVANLSELDGQSACGLCGVGVLNIRLVAGQVQGIATVDQSIASGSLSAFIFGAAGSLGTTGSLGTARSLGTFVLGAAGSLSVAAGSISIKQAQSGDLDRASDILVLVSLCDVVVEEVVSASLASSSTAGSNDDDLVALALCQCGFSIFLAQEDIIVLNAGRILAVPQGAAAAVIDSNDVTLGIHGNGIAIAVPGIPLVIDRQLLAAVIGGVDQQCIGSGIGIFNVNANQTNVNSDRLVVDVQSAGRNLSTACALVLGAAGSLGIAGATGSLGIAGAAGGLGIAGATGSFGIAGGLGLGTVIAGCAFSSVICGASRTSDHAGGVVFGTAGTSDHAGGISGRESRCSQGQNHGYT